jgi:hypothetical protein
LWQREHPHSRKAFLRYLGASAGGECAADGELDCSGPELAGRARGIDQLAIATPFLSQRTRWPLTQVSTIPDVIVIVRMKSRK